MKHPLDCGPQARFGHDGVSGETSGDLGDDAMADRHDEGYRSQVAFVTHTREYRSSEVLPALARHGFTTTERPHDRETERLISQFDPDLVVLAVDPRHDDDVALVRQVTRACNAAILVVAPGPHTNGLSLALEAGADVVLR